MPRISGIVIGSLTRSTVTTDGHHVVLQSRTVDGDDITLAVTREQVGELIDHLTLGASRIEEIVREGQCLRAAVGWWNSAVDRDSGKLALTLTFGQGGALCFDFSEPMGRALLCALRGYYEPDTDPVAQRTSPATAPDCTKQVENIMPGFVDVQ